MRRRTWIKNNMIGMGGLFLPGNLAHLFSSPQSLIGKNDFGENFKWGCATSAYQIEGATNIDGRQPSIWDIFVSEKRNIKNKHTAQKATDFYHRYREDLLSLKALNFDNFRFSISWSRILSEKNKKINSKGIDFYNRLIDFCLENNITPWLNLYHWDLPYEFEETGGWTNRDIVSYFAEYTQICCKYFGDRIKNWLILNEPTAFTAFGYLWGNHAPGRKGLDNFLPAVHHATLCQAEGGRIIRNNFSYANIGTTFACSYVSPYRETEKDKIATEKIDALLNRLFIEPTLGMGYPVKTVPVLNRLDEYMLDGDDAKMKFDFDFIGLQYYFRVVARHNALIPSVSAQEVKALKRDVKTNSMGLEIYPEGLYHVLKKMAKYEQVKEILITENGVCFDDKLEKDKINDQNRIDFFKSHLENALKAKNEGVNLKGYFVWSLTDNFEWSEGYEPRFGLIYIDYQTLNRYLKNSAYWFKDFLAKK